jgi:RecB family exonuclease
MIGFLAGFCREHPLDEKIFIVPSFSVGHQIGEALAGAGEPWVNLRFITLPALAHEAAAVELAGLGKRQAGETDLLVLVDGLFRELKSRGRLEYFDTLNPTPGVARAIYRAIQSLRLANVRNGELAPGAFRREEKARDVALLLGRYEKILEENSILDRPGLYLFALDKIRSTRPVSPGQQAPAAPRGNKRIDAGDPVQERTVWHLCLEGQSLYRLERELVEAVAGPALVLVPRDPVAGLDQPRFSWGPGLRAGVLPAAPSSDVERLPWLFDPGAAPAPRGDGSLGSFRAVGPTNECREILRRILAAKIRFDQVEVIHPPGPAYPTIFHLLAERARLPVTYSDGIPISFTPPGRVFSGLADWVDNDFLVTDLCRLIEAGDLELVPGAAEDSSSSQRISLYLRRAMIGWGRERYLGCLRSLKMSRQADLREIPHGDDAEKTPAEIASWRRSIDEIEHLIKALEDFLALIPEVRESGEGKKLNFYELCQGFMTALGTKVRLRSNLDRQALEVILSELHKAAGAGDRPAPPEALDPADALDRLRTLVSSLSVGNSSPLPGHVHVSSFESGGFSGRSLTFVVGLTDAAFPGPGPQDPVLLDSERERISSFLPTTADALKTNLYSLAVLLASLRGRVTLSYPTYDIMEERTLFPSSVLLQVHRLVRGDAGLDYTALDQAFQSEARLAGGLDPAGFLPADGDKAFDEMDWWFGRLSREGRFLDGLDAVKRSFPGLRSGLEAADARSGGLLTEYEGLVRIDRGRFDPVTNHGLTLSASRLELLARCPYGYFLRYILGIEPLEELELDRSRWLDPMQRGSLIHEVLCDFMTEVTAKDERVDLARHAPLMDKTAGGIILKWKRLVPPPSEGIFEKERKDILEALGIFLKVEAGREARVRPLAFEKRFRGFEIGLGGGRSFMLGGTIDRIDRTGPGTYRIVDYKTGSYRAYEDFRSFGKGRTIQHALYALAAEEILKREKVDPRARVTESGYYFPTRRGEGREIMVPEFDRQAFRMLLGDILDLVVKGYFVTGPEDECDFCPFASICGGTPEEIKRKVKANPGVFEAMDRLKRYD